jgi:hypothetical protein
MGLCTGKLPKLAVVEDTELIPAGLQTEEVMFRGLHTEALFSGHMMGLLTMARMTPLLVELPESAIKDLKGLLTPLSVEGRWPFSL